MTHIPVQGQGFVVNPTWYCTTIERHAPNLLHAKIAVSVDLVAQVQDAVYVVHDPRQPVPQPELLRVRVAVAANAVVGGTQKSNKLNNFIVVRYIFFGGRCCCLLLLLTSGVTINSNK